MGLIKRGDRWYGYFFPFSTEKIGLRVDCSTKGEAKLMLAAIQRACRSGDYSGLNAAERETTIRMFDNRQWEYPPGLVMNATPQEELTLWKAIQICLAYPEVKNSPNVERHRMAFAHIVEKWGKDFPVKSVWIPQIREYQLTRLQDGAAASTVNKERAALSKMFQVLIEMGLHDQNPVRMVKPPSERDGRREVYISFEVFNAIVERLSSWCQPIIWTLYLTGMRRGEVLGMGWGNVRSDERIIRLRPDQTKERKDKRIPIHQFLVPVLETAGKIRSISTDRVFLIEDGRPLCEDSLRKPWYAAVTEFNPAPTVRDLRHVWKTNAMRSGMDFELR